MEDLDKPREQPGAADAILRALDALGLHWDGAVEYQSRRSALYRDALARLKEHTYPCGCTRSEIADSALAIDGARVYGGSCRGGLPPGKTARTIRIRAEGQIRFVDRVQGSQVQQLERDVGDFVLWRADGQFAYQLAVVVDDAEQGVTDVVRGADLLDSTARQIYLQRLPRLSRAALPARAGGGECRGREAFQADRRRAGRYRPPGRSAGPGFRLSRPSPHRRSRRGTAPVGRVAHPVAQESRDEDHAGNGGAAVDSLPARPGQRAQARLLPGARRDGCGHRRLGRCVRLQLPQRRWLPP